MNNFPWPDRLPDCKNPFDEEDDWEKAQKQQEDDEYAADQQYDEWRDEG